MSGALAAALFAYGQEPSSNEARQAQDTVLVGAPAKDASVERKAQEPQKIVWKSEEAKRRNSAHPSVEPEAKASPVDGGQARAVSVGSAVPGGPSAMRLILAFAIMGLLLYGLYYVLKKYGKQIGVKSSSSDLKVLSKTKIDSKNSLALVQFHEDQLLLGVNSSGGLTLLANHKQIELVQDELSSGKVAESDRHEDEESDLFDSFDKVSAVDLKILGEKLK